jgi:hypothetical protein
MALTVLWISGAALLGISVASIFAGWLKLKRNIYLLFYVPFAVAFFITFLMSNKINIGEILIHNRYQGLAGAVIASAFVVKNVLSQPSSARNKGRAFLSDICWPGFAYGLADSLLLSVLPVLAVQLAFDASGETHGFMVKAGFGALAFLASIFVTIVYHLGYPEFRGKKVIWPVIGNGVLTLAYLITMNPLAAILPHIAMHITAMIHGRETTGQVPPHYDKPDDRLTLQAETHAGF